jgi:hypothetical protein
MLAHARGGGGFFNKGKTSGSRLIKKYWGENVIKNKQIAPKTCACN